MKRLPGQLSLPGQEHLIIPDPEPGPLPRPDKYTEEQWERIIFSQPAEEITAPPCVDCKHWRPSRSPDRYAGDQFPATSARLCWAEAMQPDFSCFESGERDFLKTVAEASNGN